MDINESHSRWYHCTWKCWSCFGCSFNLAINWWQKVEIALNPSHFVYGNYIHDVHGWSRPPWAKSNEYCLFPVTWHKILTPFCSFWECDQRCHHLALQQLLVDLICCFAPCNIHNSIYLWRWSPYVFINKLWYPQTQLVTFRQLHRAHVQPFSVFNPRSWIMNSWSQCWIDLRMCITFFFPFQ